MHAFELSFGLVEMIGYMSNNLKHRNGLNCEPVSEYMSDSTFKKEGVFCLISCSSKKTRMSSDFHFPFSDFPHSSVK